MTTIFFAKAKNIIFGKTTVVLLVIMLLGLLLRLCGVNFGLPYLYDFDEKIFVDRAYYMLGNRDPNPHWFGAPASITIYSLCITYVLIFAVGFLLGQFQSPSDFKELYLSDPTVFYLTGRLISVSFGTAIIGLTYLIARKITGNFGGYIAALMVAILPLNIQFSRLIRMDMPMVFFVLLAFLFCLEILQTNSWKSHICSGLSLGLAISCKYPAVFFSPVILAAHLVYLWRTKIFTPTRIIASGFASVLACFLSAPFAFLDFSQTLKDVFFESRSEHLGATGGGLIDNLWWYINVVLQSELGLLGLLLSILAICYGVSRRDTNLALTTFAIFIFLISISSLSLRWERWILPLFPFLAILLSSSITSITDLIRVSLKKKKLMVILLTTLVLVTPLSNSLLNVKTLMGDDTRTLATVWIEQNLPNHSRILVELGAPQLQIESFQILQVSDSGEPYVVDQNSYDAKRFIPEFKFIGNLQTIHQLKELEVDYIVMTDVEQRYRKELENTTNKSKDEKSIKKVLSIYQQVRKIGHPVYHMKPKLGSNPGPEITIYSLP